MREESSHPITIKMHSHDSVMKHLRKNIWHGSCHDQIKMECTGQRYKGIRADMSSPNRGIGWYKDFWLVPNTPNSLLASKVDSTGENLLRSVNTLLILDLFCYFWNNWYLLKNHNNWTILFLVPEYSCELISSRFLRKYVESIIYSSLVSSLCCSSPWGYVQ